MVRFYVMAALLVLGCLATGCRSAPPSIHYYQLLGLPLEGNPNAAKKATLGVDYLSANAAYEDTRIIYRKSPYRLDYYNFHRWSAPPSVMVTDAMREALQSTGDFAAVRSGYVSGVDLLLKGRLVALEEVDVSEDEWKARVILDLQVVDTRSGDVIWSRVVRHEEEVADRTPEGVAVASSKALQKIVAEISPEIASAPRSQPRPAKIEPARPDGEAMSPRATEEL